MLPVWETVCDQPTGKKSRGCCANENRENCTCDTCGLSYTSKQGLQDYEASQHEDRAAHACQCGKKYRHATNL
ncbi:hypothetical protein DPMN_082592 [Dreissena polymorpha]|uniref:C2H2-type domain-containing protein n=1 Tax=Dreissena polymorpha TaxID=45954 RepID=A0A9D4BAA1_DREPO|nr:hypothetical protein DPMN_082592 [Dreissena polymorpha]